MKEFKGFRVDRLRKAMNENGSTVEDIAKSLFEEADLIIEKNFAYGYAENLIHGEIYDISGSEFYAVCKAVNVSADYLLGLSDEMY